MTGPLDSLKVLDFSRLIPGPYATQILADLGASVIKVEDPGMGDYLRAFPPYAGPYGAAFAYYNRGKQGITLDLKNPGGRDVARRLAAQSAVLVESFRPGVMASLGLGWPQLSRENSRLVYCSISGYGQEGPLAGRAGHDINYVALSGLLSVGGPAGGDPVLPGVPVADLAGGGLWSVIGILAALRESDRTGRGQHLDVPMTAGAQAFLGVHGANSLASTETVRRGESLFSGSHPAFGVYRCADGRHLAVGALESKFWRRLCEALELDGTTDALSMPPEEWPAVRERLETIFSRRTRDEWSASLSGLDCCVEPVLGVPECFDHPQSAAIGMTVEVPTEGGGSVRQPAFPVKLSATPAVPGGPAPTPGRDTRAILLAAGYSETDVGELERSGAFGERRDANPADKRPKP